MPIFIRALTLLVLTLIPFLAHAQTAPIQVKTTYGLHCDGSTDDTSGLNAWFSALASTSSTAYELPGGYCVHSGQLILPSTTNTRYIRIIGNNTRIIYNGSSTTLSPIVSIGNYYASSCAEYGWDISGIQFISNTRMVSGVGVQINSMCESNLNIVIDGGIFRNRNYYDGLQMNMFNTVHIRGIMGAQGRALILNGDPTYQATDVYLSIGISYSGVGVDVAGNTGGVTFRDSDILENGLDVWISRHSVNVGNNQILFGPDTALDLSNSTFTSGTVSAYNYYQNLRVDDAGGPQAILRLSGTWLASATYGGMYFAPGTHWNITMSGGGLLNYPSGPAVSFDNGGSNVANFVGTTIGSVSTGFNVGSGSTVKKCGIMFNGVTNPAVGAVGSSC